MTDTPLHLASASARRVDILTALGLAFTAEGVDIDESPLAGETVGDMVLRLAEAKARAASGWHKGSVLGADTAVELDGRIFGKPVSQEDALEMLASLSGRSHQVVTAVALLTGDSLRSHVSVTQVRFCEISPHAALQYWHSGEPEGKAGAYAIQGLGGIFVESISGSYSGVVGLPVYQTARLLAQAGITILTGACRRTLHSHGR